MRSPSVQPLSESIHWPYLAAAAVLTDFAPDKLRPLGGGQPSLAAVGAMLEEHGAAILRGPAKGRWRLNQMSRLAALVELARSSRLMPALSANDQPDNPTQKAFAKLVRERGRDLADTTLTDLLGMERALDLFGPVIDTGPEFRNKVLERIERLRLLEPLERFVANGFAGREKEIEILKDYVNELPSSSFYGILSRGVSNALSLFRHRPILTIHGPGGVGKSTLLAKFLLDHAGPKVRDPLPFVYLDFDRAQLDPWHPETIFREALRQIQIQLPDFAESASNLESKAGFPRSGDVGRFSPESDSIRAEFVRLLTDISSKRGKNLLFFIDTFEVVQRKGPTPAFNILKIAGELLRDVPTLRIVVAGRAELRSSDFDFSDRTPHWKPVVLQGFKDEAGRVYLEAQLKKAGVTDVATSAMDRIVSLVRGNPLSLRLAAQVFARENLTALEGVVAEARFDGAFSQERLQGVLHNRLLAHLPDRLRRIADPGLVVRRITPQVIEEVLAGPCGLELKEGEAEDLFRDLGQQVDLAEPFGEDMLRHRPDVRLLMLPLLRAKIGDTASKIDRNAAEFWMREDSLDGRAEAIYHLLWLGTDRDQLDGLWEKGVSTAALDEAWDEFEALDTLPSARIWLCDKLGSEISSALRAKASLDEWERSTELSVRSLLSRGSAKEALSQLSGREKSPASPLWLLQIEALRQLGMDDQALGELNKALEKAKQAPVPSHVSALCLQKALLLERQDRLEEAKESASQSADIAGSAGDPSGEFEALLVGARLARKSGLEAEAREARERLSKMIDLPAVELALDRNATLLGEASAELGPLRPDLLIRLAERSLMDGVLELQALGVVYSGLGEPVKAEESFRRAVSKARSAGDTEAEAEALCHLGSALFQAGRASEAEAAFRESAAEASAHGNRTLESLALSRLGAVLVDTERIEEGIQILQRALDLVEDGDLQAKAETISLLAGAFWAQGRYEKAASGYARVVELARESGDPLIERNAAELRRRLLQSGDTEIASELERSGWDRLSPKVETQEKVGLESSAFRESIEFRGESGPGDSTARRVDLRPLQRWVVEKRAAVDRLTKQTTP